MHKPYKRGGVWWVRFEGKRRSTKCTDRAAADATIREWQRASADPSYAGAKSATLKGALASLIVDLKRRGRAQATLEKNAEKGAVLVDVIGDRPLVEIDARAVDAFIAQREATGTKPLTIVAELGTLRQALKLARRRDEYHVDPAKVLPVSYSPRYEPRERWLTPRELMALVSALRSSHKRHGGHDRAARVCYIVATSARWSESCSARREDFREDGSVYLHGTKTEAARRTVPVIGLFDGLRSRCLAWAKGTARLFLPWPKVHDDLKRACRKAGIAPVTPNDLRRTTAKWLRHAGVEPHLIAAVLGHTTSAMVERVYGRVDPAELGRLIALRVVSLPYRAPGARGPSGREGRMQNTEKSVVVEVSEESQDALGKRCSNPLSYGDRAPSVPPDVPEVYRQIRASIIGELAAGLALQRATWDDLEAFVAALERG